ncbi:hypothetical protein CVT26_009690 [Gymnopilus dilepis]|uniref:Major facilitator superfamily (MFS) profile domain-containing protein n=1 Tax=Gymnopilus dilepis TaxID=231916 RepID=A0A409YBM9_9AGAR|nr:hypothetical protein CVT26_009690 [Gymnopilus dilepis]
MIEEKASVPFTDEKRLSISTASVDFGGESSLPPPPTLTAEEERRLWRKVDMRLVPMLSLMYLLSYMDRGNIGNARLQGLQTQLDLTGNRYNIALTMYFIPYCLFECPANLVLKRFHPSRWLPGITVSFAYRQPFTITDGAIASDRMGDSHVRNSTTMGLVKNYPQLVGVRVCLGVAEAGLFPGVVYYLSLWYPRHKLQVRIGLFYGAATVAGAFSGLLAFGISFMSGTRGLLGWSWIFILEGIATVVVGILAAFVLVDFPSTATFLTPEERSYLVHVKKYDNSSVGEEEHFEMRHLWAAMTDWQVWLHILIYMSIVGPIYGITLFLPTIINSFGHSPAISQLLTVPPYIFATLLLLAFAYFSDRIKMRSPFILLGLIFCLIGFSINISNAPNSVKYFGIFFCVGGGYAAFPGIVAWLGNNLAGQYKRGIGMAIHIGVGNFSGAMACNIYRSQDAPRYIVGHGCELMFVGLGLITVPIAIVTYIQINKQRDAAQREALERGEVNNVTDFGCESTLPPPPSLTPQEVRRLWRKVDVRLVPILSLLYLLSYMDRGNIGNARLQGLGTQLDLSGNRYNIALTMFFIPYCLFECPSNLVLKRFHPSRWLPGMAIAWGVVMTTMGLVKSYPQLVGVRVCLGFAEAGLFPGVAYYLSLWYPRHMLQVRIGLFYGATTVAGAFSGLLAFGISFMNGTRHLLGWSWIFILEGIATVCVGILAIFILVDFPSTATFLTPEERSYLVHVKKYDNSSVGEEEHFEIRHFWAAVTDWQVWLHVIIYMSIVGPTFAITIFLPTIINSFGHSPTISQLLTVPPYIFAALLLLTFAHVSDRIKMRSPFIFLGLVLGLIGFSINISNAPNSVKYFGIFLCIGGGYAAFPGGIAWLSNNLAGQYKRGIGMSVHIGIGNFSAAMACNIYRSQDAPRYVVGHGCALMFIGLGLLAVPTAVASYIHINKQRDIAQRQALDRGELNNYTPKQLKEMGDRAPDFRYTL